MKLSCLRSCAENRELREIQYKLLHVAKLQLWRSTCWWDFICDSLATLQVVIFHSSIHIDGMWLPLRLGQKTVTFAKVSPTNGEPKRLSWEHKRRRMNIPFLSEVWTKANGLSLFHLIYITRCLYTARNVNVVQKKCSYEESSKASLENTDETVLPIML